MPRPGQVKPETDERLSDRIAVGLLTRSFPPELVDRVVAGCGRSGQRNRLLPPRVVVYFVLAMCLFSGQGYEEVARLLTHGLAWAKRWSGSWQVPTTAAISRARVKLGPEPLKALFDQVARPLATEATRGAFYGRWRLMAIDGTVFDVPDSQVNAAHFGRPKTHRTQRCAYPQVRVVALAECGTHSITTAALGPFTTSEPALARELFGHLGEGDCCWPTAASPAWSCGGRPRPAVRICCGASVPTRCCRSAKSCPTARTCQRSSRPRITASVPTRKWCG